MKPTHKAQFKVNGPYHAVVRYGKLLAVFHPSNTISFAPRAKATRLTRISALTEALKRDIAISLHK